MSEQRLSLIQKNILGILKVLENTTKKENIHYYKDSKIPYWSYWMVYEGTKICYAEQGKIKEYQYHDTRIKELYELLHPEMKGKIRYNENSYKVSFSRSLRNLKKKGLISLDRRFFNYDTNQWHYSLSKINRISLTDKGREVLMLKQYFNNKEV